MSDVGAVTYKDSIPVTQSDTVNDPNGPFHGFYTAQGGDITVTTVGNPTGSVTFKGTAAGIVVPQEILRVWVTGTTPANVLGCKAHQLPTPLNEYPAPS